MRAESLARGPAGDYQVGRGQHSKELLVALKGCLKVLGFVLGARTWVMERLG